MAVRAATQLHSGTNTDGVDDCVALEASGTISPLPDRRALSPPLPDCYEEARAATFSWMAAHADDLEAMARVTIPFYEGRFEEALRLARAGW